MITELISKLGNRVDLTYDDVSTVMSGMLSGNYANSLNAEFLSKLADKGETDDELLGMLDKMQEFAIKVEPRSGGVIDMCGTGGDGLGTLNISTAASFVVAAAGGKVAKHGNRSSTGVSGSADIFEHFGCKLELKPADVVKILEKYNITFMFAQKFHPAMRHVAAARKQLSGRTAFNLLGPLSNPACVKDQLVGAYSTEFLKRIPDILRRRGAQHVIAVRSDNGMDEFSTSATNRICILQNGQIHTDSIEAEAVGLHRSSLVDIQIKTKEEAIKSFIDVLKGTANKAMIETVAFNAAGGLVVGSIVNDLKHGVELALDAINSGKAFKLLEEFVSDTGDASKLREIA